MDTVMLICLAAFLVYFSSRIKKGMFSDVRRKPMFIVEMILLLGALVYTAPTLYRAVKSDIQFSRLTPDTAVRVVVSICALYVLVIGIKALFFNKRDKN